MASRPRIGAAFPSARPVSQLPDVATRLERLGFDELWVVEDCFAYGGLTAAATALSATTHLSVGVGLLPASVRNVAIAAMELSTLAELYPQRLQVAIGHGIEEWMKQIGARPRNRIKALREVVTATRALLRGETVNVQGEYVVLDRVLLAQPPGFSPPVLVGTTGRQGIAVAGEIADGLLLPEGAGEAMVRSATGALPHDAQVVVYAWLRCDEDGQSACECVLPTVRAWRDGGLFPNLVAHSGLDFAGPIGAREVERVAVVGTPEDCAEAVMRLHRAGASSIVLMPVGEDPSAQLERFAADVLPLVVADGPT